MPAVIAPATIGNVGPGFDVLGLAVDGIRDVVGVDLVEAEGDTVVVTGRDAALIPADPLKNAAAIAARAMLERLGMSGGMRVTVEKGLPVSGGMGGSAASSVGGALAASLAAGARVSDSDVIQAALVGEAAVAGRHLDNIAPCVLGGLTLVRSTDPLDVVRVQMARKWWVALVSPDLRVETKAARAILPREWDRNGWVAQMANTSSLLVAFISGDLELARRSLVDLYAEPRRAALIPHFHDVKAAALAAGAIGCSISGAGPTVFALAGDEETARRCGDAMQRAFAEISATVHVGAIATQGARPA